MWTDGKGTFYLGDCREGDREATVEESSAWLVSASIPDSVTMQQARLALHEAGLLSQVDAAIAAMQEPQKTEASIVWEYSGAVKRTNPIFILLANSLGITSEQIDALMIAAATK